MALTAETEDPLVLLPLSAAKEEQQGNEEQEQRTTETDAHRNAQLLRFGSL